MRWLMALCYEEMKKERKLCKIDADIVHLCVLNKDRLLRLKIITLLLGTISN